tara:strand:+ start:272 stop:718 length:447 start_codon:yes stop_codon:yes gene_type:complete
MKINVYCFLAFAFLISGIYLAIMKPNTQIFINFMNSLDPQQQDLYEERIKERLHIYILGMCLGILAATLYYYTNKSDNFLICKFISIVYIVKLLVYHFTPKSPLMLNYLTNQNQVQLWAKIYNTMKYRWLYSLLFGTIGYFFIALSIK